MYSQGTMVLLTVGAFEQSHNLLQTPAPQTKLHQTNFLFTLQLLV